MSEPPLRPTDRRGALDLHAHVLTDSYREACIEAGYDKPDGFPGLPEWSAESALATMDDVGVDASVLTVSSPGVYLGSVEAARSLSKKVNDEMAEVVSAHPDRFGFAASLPLPDVEAAVAEATRTYAELDADAISLHTNYAGMYLGDPAMTPVLRCLEDREAIVLVHPTSPFCWEGVSFDRPRPMVEFLFDTTRAVFNLALNGVFSSFRKIRWVIPHSGGAISVMADRVHLFAPFFAKPGDAAVDVLDEVSRLYYDVAGVPLPRALPALLKLTKASQIVYGSDYPFTPAQQVRSLATSLVEADSELAIDQADLLWRNAARLFPRFAS